MDTIKEEHSTHRKNGQADKPQCESCGSGQVQLGITTRNLGQHNGFASRNVAEGQWLHCTRCDHRWFVPADVIQEAANYLRSLEDDQSQNLELRKIAGILRLLSERVTKNDAIVAQFMQERP